MSDIETKYWTTSDYYKFEIKIFETKKKEKGLVDKSSSSYLVRNSN